VRGGLGISSVWVEMCRSGIGRNEEDERAAHARGSFCIGAAVGVAGSVSCGFAHPLACLAPTLVGYVATAHGRAGFRLATRLPPPFPPPRCLWPRSLVTSKTYEAEMFKRAGRKLGLSQAVFESGGVSKRFDASSALADEDGGAFRHTLQCFRLRWAVVALPVLLACGICTKDSRANAALLHLSLRASPIEDRVCLLFSKSSEGPVLRTLLCFVLSLSRRPCPAVSHHSALSPLSPCRRGRQHVWFALHGQGQGGRPAQVSAVHAWSVLWGEEAREARGMLCLRLVPGRC
jgi:hypothetical protein